MKLFFNISVLLLLLLNNCSTDPVVSEIPELNFESVTLYKNRAGKDSMIILTLNYKDGDGDVGLSEADSLPPFNFGSPGFNNLLVGYKVKKNAIWQNIIIPGGADTLNFNQRFQRLNTTNKNKTVTGTIDLRIPASPYPGIFPDTVKLVSQMVDRKLHKSNITESSAINLKH